MSIDLTNYFDSYQEQHQDKVQYFRQVLSNSSVDLYKLVRDAFTMTKEEASHKNPIFMNRNHMANTLNQNMVGLAIERYGSLVVDGKYGRKYLNLDKQLWVFLKKLDKKYLSSNISTGNVRSINGQNLFNKEAEKIHALYAGPVVHEDWSDIIDSFVVCRNDFFKDKTEWVEYLSKYKKSVDAPIISIESVEEETLVKIKRNNEDGKTAENTEK